MKAQLEMKELVDVGATRHVCGLAQEALSQMKRVYILGAGFSKPAGMPLATELLPLLLQKLKLDEMKEWLDGLHQRLVWLSGGDPNSFRLNIEQVFHQAHFDVQVHRLRQHLAPVGCGDGPGTPWNASESISAWLSYLEDALRDVVFESDEKSNLEPIDRWAECVSDSDAVLTFNYDTLVEPSLAAKGKSWNHGTGRKDDAGIPVFKLHGSIDWIVAHRTESFKKLELLFDKKNSNREDGKTGHVEDDCRLWRCQTREQLKKWIEGRDLQSLTDGASPMTVGIAGLGVYKELHLIPGLGRVWANGMQCLNQADLAIVAGFSLSDFDAMAQMQFAEVARARIQHSPLKVLIVDPVADAATKERFRRVFRSVEFHELPHQDFDWGRIHAH